jgi:hypothetical protein
VFLFAVHAAEEGVKGDKRKRRGWVGLGWVLQS